MVAVEVLKSPAMRAKAGRYKSIANGVMVESDPSIQMMVWFPAFVFSIRDLIISCGRLKETECCANVDNTELVSLTFSS